MHRTGVIISWVAFTALVLAACSPPPRTLAICKARAEVEVRDRGLGADDVSELIEACMLQRGWALREEGPRCSDTPATPFTLSCYYKNNLWGRTYSKFFGS